MTVRLRLICEGNTSEYMFDRPRISLGRGPFNDIVIASGAVAPNQATLVLEQDRMLLEIEGSTQPTVVVRDGEILAEVEREAPAKIDVAAGDFLLFGAAVRLEILSVRAQVVDRWEVWSLDAGRERTPSPELTHCFLKSSEEIAKHPGELRAMLEQCAILSEVALQGKVRRLVVSVFTDSDEFLDDTWALDLSLGPDNAEIFDVARAPLVRFGGDGAQRARALLESEDVFLTASGERTRDGLVIYIGLPSGVGGGSGVLALEMDRARSSAAIAPLARALRALASLCVSIRAAERRARSSDEENRYFRERERRHYLFKELVCESPGMRAVHRRLNQMVESSSPVLILGEAGSGKELIARALHHLGERREGMFISLHCGRHNNESMGVELFGCVASELAGALAARKGIFELAHDGTVYLEEIDLLSPTLQGKLVRMLKEGEVRRVGGAVGRRVFSRLVVSTHRPPRELVQTGKLRHDLFLALKEHTLEVPALRRRHEDLMPLARLFLKTFARRYDRQVSGFDEEVTAAMERYDWPGNVRELQSFVESAVLKCAEDAPEIMMKDTSI